MAQTIGIVDLSWRGSRLAVMKGASIKPGGIGNASAKYGRGVMRSQAFEETVVKAKILIPKGVRYDDIVSPAEGELLAICDTGTTYSLPAAFIIGRPEQMDDGSISVEWHAGEYEEISG